MSGAACDFTAEAQRAQRHEETGQSQNLRSRSGLRSRGLRLRLSALPATNRRRRNLRCALVLLATMHAWAGVPDGATIAAKVGGPRGFAIGPITDEYPRNGEGSTIRLKDGRLLHAYSRHRMGENNNPDLWPGVIAFTTSNDDGGTWTPPEVVFRNPVLTAMQPSFARMPDGTLGVTYSLIDSVKSARKVYRGSQDEGKTWSDPIVLSPPGGYWTGAHDRMVVLSSGRVLYPMHTKFSVSPERLGTRVTYSDDSGRTWKLSPQMLSVDDVIPGSTAEKANRRQFFEASIVEREDRSLFMVGRTMAGRLYSSTSRDRGETWTKPAPTPLPSGAAPGFLRRVPGSNDLLLVWSSCCVDKDDFVLGQRISLASAISRDGGATWRWRRSLVEISPGPEDAPHWADYPSFLIEKDRVLFSYRLVLGKGKAALLQQRFDVLPLAWFFAGRDRDRRPSEQPQAFSRGELSRAFSALPATPPTNREIGTTEHVGFKVARVENRDGPREVQPEEDRLFHVLSGSAVLRVGDSRDLAMEAGAVLIVPRGVPYQILAKAKKVEFLVTRVK
jgi:sialidase-1